MKKTSFLVALATAKHVDELQAIFFQVVTQGGDLVLAYLPEFRAKIETELKLIPRSFPLKPLSGIIGTEEEEHLSPVRAVK